MGMNGGPGCFRPIIDSANPSRILFPYSFFLNSNDCRVHHLNNIIIINNIIVMPSENYGISFTNHYSELRVSNSRNRNRAVHVIHAGSPASLHFSTVQQAV